MLDCPNGELGPSQFTDICCEIFPWNKKFQNFSQHIFRTFDTNNDGFLDFQEFLLGLHITSEGTREEKFAWLFNLYDQDGDGVIELSEMKRYAFYNFKICPGKGLS